MLLQHLHEFQSPAEKFLDLDSKFRIFRSGSYAIFFWQSRSLKLWSLSTTSVVRNRKRLKSVKQLDVKVLDLNWEYSIKITKWKTDMDMTYANAAGLVTVNLACLRHVVYSCFKWWQSCRRLILPATLLLHFCQHAENPCERFERSS